MIIELSGKPVVNDLFQNNNEMIDQIHVSDGVLLDLVLKVVESTCHDTRLLITERFLHFGVHFFDGVYLVKLDKHHNCLLPNHFMLVVKQPCDMFTDGQNDLLTANFGETVESRHYFQVV